MESNILNLLGLSNIDPAILLLAPMALILILLIIVIAQSCKISKVVKRYNKFMNGKEAKSLEEEIVELFNDNKRIRAENEKNHRDIQDINKRMQKTFQKIGLEKYDAFNQMGGALSFALCLLDENDNGFIINSVHSTDGLNYSYSKAINGGIADVELGAEEKKALDSALSSLSR
ncbi:MAG: DUF4446 family protein [Butyrivibrio sp.]|nr:DUF4446 family protein [Butyrivibrio sp.]